jgi:hypothetical protein
LQPPIEQDILFIAVGQIYLGFYTSIFDILNKQIFMFSSNGYQFEAKDVKYWQPLPKMPN